MKNNRTPLEHRLQTASGHLQAVLKMYQQEADTLQLTRQLQAVLKAVMAIHAEILSNQLQVVLERVW